MIPQLQPYPATRDSGVNWLGEVPVGWEVRRNGGLFAQRNETGYPDLPILEVSLRTGVRVRSFGESARKQVVADRAKYKRAAPGDVAYNMMRMWQGAVGVVPTEGLISPAYVVARPLPGTDPAYFAYLYRTDGYMGEVDNYSRGIVKDRNRLYWERFKQIPTPCPPPSEQAAIVRFLGHADRQIGRYIRAKQELRGLLEEQKQAIIHRAVTRGLDPNVRLKFSGVEWLGDVPEHWEVLALRRRWSVTDCKHLTVPFVEDEDAFPLASVREVQAFDLSLATAKRTTQEFYENLIEGGRRPRKGDLIYCRNVSVGAAAVVTTEEPVAMGQDVCLIRSAGESQRYLNRFLRSPAMRHQLSMLLIGSTFNRINVADIKALTIVVPPRNEQDAIAEFLDSRSHEFKEAQELAAQEIRLLRELRSRLVADVVTGKLDVREAAQNLPIGVDEPEEEDADETSDEAESEEPEDEREAV